MTAHVFFARRTAVASTRDPSIGDAGAAVDVVLTRPVIAVGVVLGTWLLTRIARGVLRRVVRRVADRAGRLPGRSSWRVRVQRVFGETADVAEKRRRQRIDAVSRMLGHMVSLIAWITAAVVVLHIMQVDLVPVLTSAGFIGAGLAIGGQHAVRDFIAGVAVLVEDRYGIGDRIVVETVTGKEVEGIVEHVGAFSTRLSTGPGQGSYDDGPVRASSTHGSTFHVSNGSLVHVRNLSQQPVTTAIEVIVPERAGDLDAATDAAAAADDAVDAVALALAKAAGDRQLTGMVLVDDVRAHLGTTASGQQHVQVQMRTAQPISGGQADVLQRVANDALREAMGAWRRDESATRATATRETRETRPADHDRSVWDWPEHESPTGSSPPRRR